MGIILGEAPYTCQSEQHPGAFVAINSAQFCITNWQFLITTPLCFVDQDVSQTVHWFKDIFLPFYLHRAVQVVTVKLPVAAGFPQVYFGNMRGVYDVVTAINMFILPEVFNSPAYYRSLGVPED